MIGKLNHVGVATASIDEALKVYRDTLGVAPEAITEKRSMPERL